MEAANIQVLTINGGSSTIKFAAFQLCDPPERLFQDTLEIGAPDHETAARGLIARIESAGQGRRFDAIAHRVVHGGLHLCEHQVITPEVMALLREAQPLDLAHLPREIALIEAFQKRFPEVTQVACFDTEFHRNLPLVSQLLPIPRRFIDAGVRRLGFHGLSYTFLMQQLRRISPVEVEGRLILAHLGSGASMAAIRAGEPVDTTMAFTPLAGLAMGTRPGDLDPGVLLHMMRSESLTIDGMDDLLNKRCGLAGVSGGTSDVRKLAQNRNTDPRAAEALDLFCYGAKKQIGAYAAALGGLDTVVFSGGIGEHSPQVRSAICGGLPFLGLDLDTELNAKSAGIISSHNSRVMVRVIPTDEEEVMATIASGLLDSQTTTL